MTGLDAAPPPASRQPQIGINAPIVTAFPSSSSTWESDAGAAELSDIAVLADGLGFSHISCSEHTAVPSDVALVRGGTYWDPLATLSFLAARTRRLRLFTKVLVLGYHHPLEIVKRYGTLDRLSSGRVTLGVGVGSLEQEFALLGAQFAGRGARADDALLAIRAGWGQRFPRYSGEFYAFDELEVSPTAVQQRVPILVGGRSAASLRRAVTLGDGWVPFALAPGEIRALLARFEIPDGFTVMLTSPALDPIGAPDAAAEALASLHSAGATEVSATLFARSAAHYVEQMHALAELGQRPE